MSGTFGSGLKTVQRGIVKLATNPDTVTITAVVLAKSFVLINHSIWGTTATHNSTLPRVVLTNTTTLTFDQAVTDASLVSWQVVEYY